MKRFAFFRFSLFLALLLFCQGAIALEVKVKWSKADKVQTGVELLRLELTEPRLMKIWLMRVDLTTPGLQFTGTARDPDWGKPMPDSPGNTIRTKRIRTRDFMLNARNSGLDMIVAANSAPWTPWEKPYTHIYANPLGVAILDGEVISDTQPHRGVFVVYKNGDTDIVDTLPEKAYSRVRLATSGFAIILRKGKMLQGGGYETALHPRMAYGLSRDRKYFYILTVDGRQKDWSMGATGEELAELLLEAGAYDAVNMDGGGSTTLCYWDAREKKPVVVTRHTPGGYQRPTGANIGVYIDKSPKK